MKTTYTKLIISVLLSLSFINTKAQVREILEIIKPQKAYEGIPVLQKKSQFLHVGIGLVNNVVSVASLSSLPSILGVSGGIGVTTTSSKTGPFVLGYEYFVKNNMGIGLDLSYAKASKSYKSSLFLPGVYNYNYTATTIMISTIYHFYTTNKLDPYTKASIGATIWKAKYSKDGNEQPNPSTIPSPVAYNGVIGLRYFVTPRIAPVGELSYSNLRFSATVGVGVKL
ncbi:MAG: outer membrane beta-barrel protein [Ferruginibacter sp.]|nr:outer membrane beta-barrel protein [Ferruginibacter sp.]